MLAPTHGACRHILDRVIEYEMKVLIDWELDEVGMVPMHVNEGDSPTEANEIRYFCGNCLEPLSEAESSWFNRAADPRRRQQA